MLVHNILLSHYENEGHATVRDGKKCGAEEQVNAKGNCLCVKIFIIFLPQFP